MSRAVGIELRVEQDGLFGSTSESLTERHQDQLSAKRTRSEQETRSILLVRESFTSFRFPLSFPLRALAEPQACEVDRLHSAST